MKGFGIVEFHEISGYHGIIPWDLVSMGPKPAELKPCKNANLTMETIELLSPTPTKFDVFF